MQTEQLRLNRELRQQADSHIGIVLGKTQVEFNLIDERRLNCRPNASSYGGQGGVLEKWTLNVHIMEIINFYLE